MVATASAGIVLRSVTAIVCLSTATRCSLSCKDPSDCYWPELKIADPWLQIKGIFKSWTKKGCDCKDGTCQIEVLVTEDFGSKFYQCVKDAERGSGFVSGSGSGSSISGNHSTIGAKPGTNPLASSGSTKAALASNASSTLPTPDLSSLHSAANVSEVLAQDEIAVDGGNNSSRQIQSDAPEKRPVGSSYSGQSTNNERTTKKGESSRATVPMRSSPTPAYVQPKQLQGSNREKGSTSQTQQRNEGGNLGQEGYKPEASEIRQTTPLSNTGGGGYQQPSPAESSQEGVTIKPSKPQQEEYQKPDGFSSGKQGYQPTNHPSKAGDNRVTTQSQHKKTTEGASNKGEYSPETDGRQTTRGQWGTEYSVASQTGKDAWGGEKNSGAQSEHGKRAQYFEQHNEEAIRSPGSSETFMSLKDKEDASQVSRNSTKILY